MQEQASRLPLTSRAFRNNQLPLFAKELCELLGYDRMLPMNSGAEAVETAIKLLRKWGYKVKGVAEGHAEIIVCHGNFQGRTTTIIGFSDEDQYRDGFGPFTPGFISVAYGDADALERAITPNTVGFMVEPIQGEAGIVVPPDGYLKQVRDICTKHNILMMADEVQTGLGRTGKLLATHWEDVRADVVTLGKALSGGFYPVSAVLADNAIMGVFNPGDHGSTFGGNPMAAAIGREAIRVLVDEDMIENANVQGEYLLHRLRQIESEHIKEVRGKGLLIGVELKASAGGARRFCEALMREGLLSKETHENVVRFAPPLVIQREDIDWAMERIERVFMME